METINRIRERLNVLKPHSLEVLDESAEHAGHAGARESGGGHFRVLIVSDAFEGKNKITRHRMIYQALGDLIPARIHALAIHAYTLPEVDDQGAISISPTS
jgi:BolA protein